MSDELITIGSVVRYSVTFKDAAGANADPTNVYFRTEDPNGDFTRYHYGVDSTIVKTATGLYYADVEAGVSGLWLWRFEGTGANQSACEGSFTVPESNFV
jgi:hypothetical protein